MLVLGFAEGSSDHLAAECKVMRALAVEGAKTDTAAARALKFFTSIQRRLMSDVLHGFDAFGTASEGNRTHR